MMSFRQALLVSVLCAAAASVSADKKDKFIVGTRFNGDATVHLNRGGALLEKGDTPGARQSFEAAIRADPGIWPAYFNLALILAREEKWELALQTCNAAMRLRPGFFRTSILRATINQKLGNDRASLVDLNTVISLHADDETDAVALNQRAWLRILSPNDAIHNPAEALADAGRACRLNYWKKAIYIDTLAAACAATGDFAGAVRNEEQAIKSG
ncbi:MAG TPA: tetratricopeptide repeat protein, partial [Chthoniobacterales bacterium]|nr:tetratricopeptide repeat protein [Chthoniobacterales bacterium]